MSNVEFDPHSVPVCPPPSLEDPVPDPGFETICEHFAEDPCLQRGAAAVPIYQASTFLFPDTAAWDRREAPDSPHYEYTRVGNPTTAILGAKLARLEHGAWALPVASGMGAISAAINACVHAGAHIAAVAGVYWPTLRYFKYYLPRFGVETTFVDSVAPDDFIAALRPETKLLYLESPTSGFFDVPEIRPIAEAARARGIVTVFDNSWASPYFQQPLDLGCDLVVHSATKFIGGHSDVVAGVIIGRDEDLQRRVFREVELLGSTCDPFAAWLLLRGLRTLKLRMEQHQRSALALAEFLEQHPRVARVRHPGLERHPQHAIARRQLSGYGSLFGLELADPSKAAAYRVLDRLKLFGIGVSWGGHESLALAAPFFARGGRDAYGIRLHAGLESTTDLLTDLRQALED